MGRAEYGTPKYFSNQMKSIGLQKLKFFCQVCEKQCRDANGYKCHTQSESHIKKIQYFGTNKREYTKVIENYSENFEREFLRLLKRKHGTKKINVNKFYQEYILEDKKHIHLNSTKWSSLTSLIKHLSKEGKVHFYEDEQQQSSGNSNEDYNMNFYLISYIDHDTLQREETQKKKSFKASRTEEEREMAFVSQQMSRAEALLRAQEAEAGAEAEAAKTRETPPSRGPVRLLLKKNSRVVKKHNVFRRHAVGSQ
ncbi:Rts2p ASCRUDRAFT_73262 [Ascoidea rubescens DSM 1968]|uniref:DNA/RNA-binding protein Kin17 WH-like domain-containing protein n=1 Tax=Ascoidea rubescens DSM 1968 TaxID=1344418 RepID=A0A1D2VP52_9ASCO|nr:hypothetical protein ASCRUDRAFT_73262 [Ascoidea rubescens DSM 1968]ODV63390.1 hypothetical protein ASCRUDRAFT_73262 [Ascoidea rubescens DSM 1968]